MATYNLRVNGVSRTADSDDPSKPLLYVLRGMGLTGVKFGCGLGQCGACTVLVDGQAVRSCQTPVSATAGKSRDDGGGRWVGGNPHPIQKAFIDHQVPQCGYCTGGIIMSAAALLARNNKPTEAEIRSALEGNLCRCGTHVRVIAAVTSVAQGG